MSARALCRLAAALTVSGGVLLAVAGPASAHAYLDSTVPADGTLVGGLPSHVELHFSESVVPVDSSVVLYDSHGGAHSAVALHLLRSGATSSTETPSVLVAQLPTGLPSDVYRLRWATASADDLHRTSGQLVFGAGRSVAAQPPADPAGPQPREAAVRWLLLLGCGLLAGALGVSRLIAGAAPSSAPVRSLRRVAVAAATAALVGPVALVAAESVSAGSGLAGVAHLLTSAGYGTRWWTSELATAGFACLVLASIRRPGSARRPLLAGLGLLGAMTAAGRLGHTGSGPVGSLLTGVHASAALGWGGTVLVLALVVPVLSRGSLGEAGARRVLRSFAPWAVAGVVTAVVTGLLLSGRTVASVDGVLVSAYGRTLLVKVGLVLLALALGGANHLLVRRPARLRPASLVVEAVLVVAAVGATGALASAGPALGPRWDAPAGPAQAVAGGMADDLVETVVLRPNLPGLNVATVQVLDSRRPAPGRVTAVRLDLTGPRGEHLSLAAQPSTEHLWAATVSSLPRAGRWTVGVSVQRKGLPAAGTHYAWVVPQAAAVAPSVSPARWAPLAGASAVSVLGLVLTAALVTRTRRRTPGPAVSPQGPDLALTAG